MVVPKIARVAQRKPLGLELALTKYFYDSGILMTELYFIRHGIAAEPQSYECDDARPLTEQGVRKTRKVAKQLVKLGISFDSIFTSPFVRAHQTAVILQDFGLGNQISISPILAPDGDLRHWLSQFEEFKDSQNKDFRRFALVGHEPDLSNWAQILVWGEATGCLELKKAGIIAVRLPEGEDPIGRSHLFWLTPPRFLIED
jgi:phosphohistidine phosphatase